MISELRNKELGILELLFIGFKVFRSNLFVILVFALSVGLPIAFIQELLFPTFQQTNFDYASLITQRLFATVSIIFEIPSIISVMHIVEQYSLGKPVNWRSSLKRGFSKWGSALGNSSLSGALSLLLLLLFIIPGLIFIVRQNFFLVAVALRNLKNVSALSYSKSIVQGRWWKVFFTIIVLLINDSILNFITAYILGTIYYYMPAFDFILGISLHILANLLLYFYMVVNTIFFLNLEHRKN